MLLPIFKSIPLNASETNKNDLFVSLVFFVVQKCVFTQKSQIECCVFQLKELSLPNKNAYLRKKVKQYGNKT